MSVGQTIANQLGRSTLAMLGARNLVAIENGLQFSIGSGAKNGINKIVIKLTPADDYTVEFWRIKKADFEMISSHDGIYVDGLHECIQRHTGMETRMPRIVRG